MRNTVNIKGKIYGMALLLFSFLFFNVVKGQAKYQNSGDAKIKIEGTSNIHDWEMNSEKGSCSGIFTVGANNSLATVTGLNFSMIVETLKSEHKAMDNNTYKAIKTDKYPTIVFNAATATVKNSGGSNYTITSHGKLTISSVTKDVDITATCTVNADKSISCTGSYKLKMTDYSVTPPSIMFGMIKTGNDITVKFNFILKP